MALLRIQNPVLHYALLLIRTTEKLNQQPTYAPNATADEIAEYIDWLNFWIDTKETRDDKAIKGAFLTAVGKEAFLNVLG